MANSQHVFIRSTQDDFEGIFSMSASSQGDVAQVISKYADIDPEHTAIKNFTSINMYLSAVYSARDVAQGAGAGQIHFWADEPDYYSSGSDVAKRGRMDRYIWSGEFRKRSNELGGTVFKGISDINGYSSDGYMIIPRPFVDYTRAGVDLSLLALPHEQDAIKIKLRSVLSDGIPPNKFIPICGYVLTKRRLEPGTAITNMSQRSVENKMGTCVANSDYNRYTNTAYNLRTQTEEKDLFLNRKTFESNSGSRNLYFGDARNTSLYYNNGQPCWGLHNTNNYGDRREIQLKRTTSFHGLESWSGNCCQTNYKGCWFNFPGKFSNDVRVYTDPHGITSDIDAFAPLDKSGSLRNNTWVPERWHSTAFQIFEGNGRIRRCSGPGGATYWWLRNDVRFSDTTATHHYFSASDDATYGLRATPWSCDNHESAPSKKCGSFSSNQVGFTTDHTYYSQYTVMPRNNLSASHHLYQTRSKFDPLMGHIPMTIFGPDIESHDLEGAPTVNAYFQEASSEWLSRRHNSIHGSKGGAYGEEDWYAWNHQDSSLYSGTENNLMWIMYAHDGNGKGMLVSCPGETASHMLNDFVGLDQFNPQNAHFHNGVRGMFKWVQPYFYTKHFNKSENNTLEDLWNLASPGGDWYDAQGWSNSTVHGRFPFRRLHTHFCNMADKNLWNVLGQPDIAGKLYQDINTCSREPFHVLYKDGEVINNINSVNMSDWGSQYVVKWWRMYDASGETDAYTNRALSCIGSDYRGQYQTAEYMNTMWSAFNQNGLNIYNPSQIIAYGNVSNANLKNETEFFLNLNRQTIRNDYRNAMSEFGFHGEPFEQESEMYNTTQNTIYLSGKINNLGFAHVPGPFWSEVRRWQMSETTKGNTNRDRMDFFSTKGVTDTYIWPGLILRPVVEAGIEMSEFSFSYFEHDYNTVTRGGSTDYLKDMHRVNENMPIRYGSYGRNYDPLKAVRLNVDKITSVQGWKNVSNMLDGNLDTYATLDKSGSEHAIYIPMNGFEIPFDDQPNDRLVEIKSLSITLKGLAVTGINKQTIRMAIVDSSQTYNLFYSQPEENTLTSSISDVPLNSLSKSPDDDMGYYLVFESHAGNDVKYHDIKNGYLKIWAEAT